MIVTGSEDMTARLWNAVDGRLRRLALAAPGTCHRRGFQPRRQHGLDGQRRHESPALGRRLGPASTRASPARRSGLSRCLQPRRAYRDHWWLGSRGTSLGRQTGLAITPPLRHDGSLRALAISRDGRTVLTGSYDRTAQLWDKMTGKPIGPAFQHENQVWFVAISPDGRSVLSGGQENTAHLWNIPSRDDAPISEIERRVQVSTGMELLDNGSIHILDFDEWNERRSLDRVSIPCA